MTYYVPQQAVPATSLLTAQPPPPTAPSAGSHVAGGVNVSGPNGPSSTAGPSINSSNANNVSGASAGCIQNNSHLNGPAPCGYQPHGSSGGTSGGSHNNGTTYYGTGRIKRSNQPHFSSCGAGGAPQVMATAALPNGVSATTYQLGHAVPTLTLAATGPAPATAGVPASSDLSGSGATPGTTTMYALPQHATLFPTNMFPYAANAAQAIGPQPTANMTQQAALISQHGNPQIQTTSLGHQHNAAAGAIHNPHHSNTVITPFYTTTHHHNPHAGIHAGGHALHAPGPAAIPIVDPASLINASQNTHNTSYGIRGGGNGVGGNSNSTSQSAPSTPHSMPSAPHYTQRNPPAFSTPPIVNNNGGGYNSASSTPQYYSSGEQNHHGGANSSNSPHNSYTSGSYEKRNNSNANSSCGGGKKSLSYQSASLSRQNSTNTGGGGGGGYSGSGKPTSLLVGGNNNDTRASPGSNSTNSRPHSIKRSGGGGGNNNTNANDKPQTPLLSGPPSYPGNANVTNTGYQSGANVEVTSGGVVPVVSVAKPPIRLNAAAAAFRHKGSAASNTMVDYRRNPASQRNSPSTNASSSNDNSNNNSPNSIHNSSNAATPIAAGCYAPTYMINAQNNAGDGSLGHPPPPPSLYITTTTARGPAHHIPPHLQSAAAAAAGGAAAQATAAQAAAAAANNAAVSQQAANAVLGGAAAAAAAADVANAAAVAAATVAHHHHHPQPLLGTYNPSASGLYFKYGHTYFAHVSTT